MSKTIRVIGAPVDLGASRRGTDMGPSAMRAAGLHTRLRSLGYEVQDAGNVHAPEMEQQATDDGLRYADEILHACTHLADLVEAAVADGVIPLVLGGDHSVAIGTQAGLARHSKSSINGESFTFKVEFLNRALSLDDDPAGALHLCLEKTFTAQ